MKKFAKVSLITAGILFVMGCIFGSISVLAGGNVIRTVVEEEFWKGEGKGLIRQIEKSIYYAFYDDVGYQEGMAENDAVSASETTVAEAEESGTVTVTEDDGNVAQTEAGETATETETTARLDGYEVNGMKLQLAAGTFIIEEKDSGDDTIEIVVSGEGNLDYYVKGETLYIKGFKKIKWYESKGAHNMVEIRVPSGSSFEKIEVETGASIVKMQDINVKELEAEIGAGELILNGLETTKLSVEIGAGRMEALHVQTKDADLETTMGECIYTGSITGNLEAECGMGNMEFVLSGREREHNYEIECTAGNVSIGSFYTSALASQKKINNNAASQFKIECSMGNISMVFE